jgi:FAD/FMN-containing dehydrogenase/Fe-S oxidoreductase
MKLPRLTPQAMLDPIVDTFSKCLYESGFEGDIELNYASRLSVATDNSVYQILPQGVLFPKHTQDVALIGQLSSQDEFIKIGFTPRGGGTGTNGQSLTTGMVLDLSRHMNQILEINAEEKWVRVQSGVVKDQLNDALRPLGYFFSPDLSTSNRATIGGMINTDASGQGSLKYGKTSDHVLGLSAVTVSGEVFETRAEDYNTIMAKTDVNSVTTAWQTTAKICKHERQTIEATFPPLNRFLTGYDLKHTYNDKTDQVDLTRILCGSEGSLAFICEAKLNITPIPTYRTLVLIQYGSFDSALRHAPKLVEANALSVETIDSTVLDLAKKDIVWHTVQRLIPELSGVEMKGINIVEFAENDGKLQQDRVNALQKVLNQAEEYGVLGYQSCEALPEIQKIYAMRKKAVGLLGATKGQKKPIAFAEDTCVPPENLANFIAEFRALLDENGLRYGMFGHVDAGVLHVRPALDLCDPKQEALMLAISDKVVSLVAKYGGLMWGEHGKGFRSQYTPDFFGAHLYEQLRHIKTAFDPKNRLNAGKICTAFDSEVALASVNSPTRGQQDRQIPLVVRDSFEGAMACNGNGLCFNYDVHSPMCPSMKVSQDRRQSPKGRAGLIREWLRQLSAQNVDLLALETQVQQQGISVKTLMDKWRNGRGDSADFSHEVMESMQDCLACKACASQCPVKVDVPNFRARFLQLYHSRYPRPMKDHLVGQIERCLPLMAKMPKLVNGVMSPKWVQRSVEKYIGYVDMPDLSVPTLKSQCQNHQFDFKVLRSLSESEKADYILIVQDPFTSYYDANVVADLVKLAEVLGKKPILLPFKPNGKAQHIKGFLKAFGHTAKNTSAFLNQVAELNIPMVGVDPALVLCYRDEYKMTLGKQRGQFQVTLVHEWLASLALDIQSTTVENPPWYLFGHCTEKTLLPKSESEWITIFSQFGQQLESVSVGCCGMAGTYGHESNHVETSKAIYQLSWQKQLNARPMDRCLATGYSCRSQVKRFEQVKMRHPLQALLFVLTQ